MNSNLGISINTKRNISVVLALPVGLFTGLAVPINIISNNSTTILATLMILMLVGFITSNIVNTSVLSFVSSFLIAQTIVTYSEYSGYFILILFMFFISLALISQFLLSEDSILDKIERSNIVQMIPLVVWILVLVYILTDDFNTIISVIFISVIALMSLTLASMFMIKVASDDDSDARHEVITVASYIGLLILTVGIELILNLT